jgi:hypothetical protein
MLNRYFLNYLEMVPVAILITGITFVFTFHLRCISTVRSFCLKTLSLLLLYDFKKVTLFSPERLGNSRECASYMMFSWHHNVIVNRETVPCYLSLFRNSLFPECNWWDIISLYTVNDGICNQHPTLLSL